uniref:Uncharacterized protein n=1 Tax=Schistosoma japonicum TaxID=6182 RepID=Q5C1G9_SCHJA|nr:unknown [Schistosoma japonicum]
MTFSFSRRPLSRIARNSSKARCLVNRRRILSLFWKKSPITARMTVKIP